MIKLIIWHLQPTFDFVKFTFHW